MRIQNSKLKCLLGLLLLSNLSSAFGADASQPPYDFPYKNGLYGTIAGGLILYRMKIDVPDRRILKLQVPTMKRTFPVAAVIQPRPAPLVVMLLGIEGKADANSGKLWMKWFAEAGYHVLTFDSTFTPPFVEASGHGVTGNMAAEAGQVVEIVKAFLKQSQVGDKVTQIGVVGMSYGGIQSLAFGRLVQEGKVPFKVSAIQAYSPPVNMATTGAIIDKWFNEDRWNFKLTELAYELISHKPVARDEEIPFSDSMLRAAIAALFRISLADTIERNDIVYDLKLFPADMRRDYAEAWGFSKFMGEMVIPYWSKKLKVEHPEILVEKLSLKSLFLDQPPGMTQVLEAADDPFNDPLELEELQSLPRNCGLTIVPRGGHLGYIMHPYIKARLLTLFSGAPVGTEATPARVIVQAAPDAPQLKPETPQVTATATGTEDRRSTVALFAGAFRCGDKAMVETGVREANANPDYLFGTMGWPELVAEIAARSGADIQPLLIAYLAENAQRLNPDNIAHIAKMLPGVKLESYLNDQRIASWNSSATGADDALKIIAADIQAKNFAGACASLKLIEEKGQLKLLPAAANFLGAENAEVTNAAFAVFKAHADALEADVSSPKRCLIWWRLSGRQRLDELLLQGQ